MFAGGLTQEGDQVRFQIGNVFLPSPEEAAKFASGAELLEGTIVGFSDSGVRSRAFAVVEVVQRRTFVVPIEHLLLTEIVGGAEY